ncbi:protease complex subunit PrcB family protein [Salinisphaera sp. SPP-AMP-43]|uniref:protease complex subunit PrcB family protein n=1 Tax=Salinisphaera sp. SPP-AMP-43 TaxID=3121288 RepID=UPI003C6DECD4
MHYFADANDFENWVEYRNISGFDADLARDGVLIVEMGQRPTGGYKLILDREKTNIDNNTLNLVMDWHAPRLDAAVGQALTSQCVALNLPKGQYQTVRVVDQLGNLRGRVDVGNGDNGQ